MSQEQAEDKLSWCRTKTQWDCRAWWELISKVGSWNVLDGLYDPLYPGPWHGLDIEEELGNVRVHVVSALFIQPFVSLFAAGVPSSISFLKSWLVSSIWMTSGRLSFLPEARRMSPFSLSLGVSPASLYCQVLSVHWGVSGSQGLGGSYGEILDPLYPFALTFCTGNGQHDCKCVRNCIYIQSIEVRIWTLFLPTLNRLFLTSFLTLNSLNGIDNRLNIIFTEPSSKMLEEYGKIEIHQE